MGRKIDVIDDFNGRKIVFIHDTIFKKKLPEIGMAPKISVIDAYIQQKLPEIIALAEETEGKVSEWDVLNELFLRMVK